MRVLGFPVIDPRGLGAGVGEELLGALRTLVRIPAQLERLTALGEEMVVLGQRFAELAEVLDGRTAELLAMGERIDRRAGELLEVGAGVEGLADRIDTRGEEIVRRGGEIVDTAGELIAVLPTLERAIAMTTPLEGTIDRIGRLVDRLPGGGVQRRRDEDPGDPQP